MSIFVYHRMLNVEEVGRSQCGIWFKKIGEACVSTTERKFFTVDGEINEW